MSLGETEALLRDALGGDLEAGLVREATDAAAAKCQQAVAKQLDKCRDARAKAFVACKTARLATGADAPDDLVPCLDDDPKAAVARQCDLRVETQPGKLTVDGLRKTLAQQCVAKGVDLATVLPGCAPSDAAAAHACLARAAACRTCRAVAAADALPVDCDLADDGQANASCGGAAPPPIGRHVCTLDPGISGFTFDTSVFFDLFSLSGEVAVDCGVVDPTTGRATCSCAVVDIPPIPVIPNIGVACIRPSAGCPAGEVACNGGGAFDGSMTSDHTIGSCAGNASCASACATLCASSGASVFDSGCEGFCRDGTSPDASCTDDAGCPGGTCIGPDDGAHGNVCQCECLAPGGDPAAAGAFRCNLGVEIAVEMAAPCGDGDLLFPVGQRCIPFTTEGTAGVIVDANAVPDAQLPPEPNINVGLRRTCTELEAGGASGLALVSAVNVFDVPLAGDIAFSFVLACQ